MELEKLNLILRGKMVGKSRGFHRVIEKTNFGMKVDIHEKTNIEWREMRSLERPGRQSETSVEIV